MKTDYYGDTRIVDVHMRHLRAKGVPIETIHGVGYRVVAASGGGY